MAKKPPTFSRLKSVKSDGYGDFKPDQKFPPTICFNYDQLPEAKEWEVGEEYTVMLVLKQTSKHESERNDNGGGSASFDVVKIATQDDEEYEDDDEDD